MQIYLVGGAVRDAWMAREYGRPAPEGADRDWVVVGATPQDMVQAGFEPVGRDFPVFLHPRTHEEYALARTERKTAPGYRGFAFHAAPDVTLEEDLARRDLTINAMAVEARHADAVVDAPLVDPWNGLADLRARRLRHVTPAFAEDPVRILRVARFCARWPDFTVADDTLALMRDMVAHGEADHLVAERVWQEVSRGLLETSPGRMVGALAACGLLDRLGLNWLLRGALNGALESSPVFAAAGLPQRWCWLVAGERRPEPLRALCEAWRVPGELRELALMVCRERNALRQSGSAGADAVLAVFDRCDAWRRPARMLQALDAIDGESLADADGGAAARSSTQHLREALARLQSLDSAAITRAALAAGATGPAIGQRLHEARRAHLLDGRV